MSSERSFRALLARAFDSKTRLCVFIDDEHLRKELEKHKSQQPYGLAELLEQLPRKATGSPLGVMRRAYLYTAVIPKEEDEKKYEEQEARLKKLAAIPLLEINRGRIVGRGSRMRQKRVDVQLATDLVLLAAKDFYDLAILIAGDADFVDAVQGAKDLGKYVALAGFPESTSISFDLKVVTDFFVDLSTNIGPRIYT